MEDYKEKYEKALDNFKKIKASNKDNKELVDFIEYEYPELKDSKDEKIRKWLIEMVEEARKANPTNANHNGNCSDALAWLEKQGEQKPTNKVEPKFKVGDWIVTPDNEVKQIEKVAFGNYWCTDETLYDIIDIDNKGHLWTIQDAKETVVFLDMLEAIKRGKPKKPKGE